MRQILWGLAVCPGPVPGEHQLCSVVGLGLWSAVGTLFALTMSHVVSDCSWQESALGTGDWGMGWFGVGSEWWLHYPPWKVSAWKRALLCGTCSDSTPQPCCTEQNRQISESRRAFLAFWAGAEFAELVVTKQQLPCNPSSGLFGRGCVVGTCWEVPQGPAPWPWLSQLGFLPMESRVGKAGGQEQSVCWHGAGVLTQALRTEQCSRVLQGRQGLHPAVFRAAFQVCLPYSLGVWLQLISNDSYSLSAEFARGVSKQHQWWWWWGSSVTQSSAASSLSRGLGRFPWPVLLLVLPHAQGFHWPGQLHSHMWVVLL